MKCEYCDSILSSRPENGLCPNCGAVLPEPITPQRVCTCGTASAGDFCPHCGRSMVAPAEQSNQPGPRCPECQSTDTEQKVRGFSWGLAILGFLIFPTFGWLLGFVGSKRLRCHCNRCGKTWTL